MQCKSCSQVEVEPHPHIREACIDYEFDREQTALCRKFCPMCRCFVCAWPPRLCQDWHLHSTAVSTSVVSQQKRAITLRRLRQSDEPLYKETLNARAYYYDIGSSRGTAVTGKYARGRVRLRLGDAITVGHTELLFCVQPPGWAAPLRAEMASSSDDSSDEENESAPKRNSILKDLMKGTLAGVSTKRELGVDSDSLDATINPMGSDAFVADKADRLRRLSSLSSKRLPSSATSPSALPGEGTGDASLPSPKPTASSPTTIPRERPDGGLDFLSRAPSMRSHQGSFKWS